MKRTLLISILLIIYINVGFAQSKSKKELREAKRNMQIATTDSLLKCKSFSFVAQTAIPQAGRTMHLSGANYTVKVVNDSVYCSLPFYGRAYSSSSYGGDGGMNFIGKAENVTLEKKKKNYILKNTVKGEKDTYKLFFNIGFEGTASLSISSNNRSSISYNGTIESIKK